MEDFAQELKELEGGWLMKHSLTAAHNFNVSSSLWLHFTFLFSREAPGGDTHALALLAEPQC